MPKLKTNKAAAKRFKKTASGKFQYQKQNKRHILGHMSTKRKRHLRRPGTVSAADEGRLKRMLPYA